MRPWSGSRTVDVLFSKYTPGINPNDALECLSFAQGDAEIQILKGDGLDPIGHTLSYTVKSVTLTFNPRSSVRWFYWALALTSMPIMFAEYEFVGFEFMVVDTGSSAGQGSLIWRE